MSFESRQLSLLLARVYSAITSLTLSNLRVSVEGPLSTEAAFGMLQQLYPQWR
jgi:hypothetical protein